MLFFCIVTTFQPTGRLFYRLHVLQITGKKTYWLLKLIDIPKLNPIFISKYELDHVLGCSRCAAVVCRCTAITMLIQRMHTSSICYLPFITVLCFNMHVTNSIAKMNAESANVFCFTVQIGVCSV